MSLVSPVERLVGYDRPRIESAPAAWGTFGPKVGEFAGMCGVNLDDWQQHVINGLFAVDEAGMWVASEFGLLVSRQNGKGEILVAYDLAQLFLFPRIDNRRKTVLHSAHEFKTAMDGFQRLSGVVESQGKLMDRVAPRGIKVGSTEVGITLKKRDGQLNADRIRFIARSKNSGRGLAGDCNVYDEAQEMASRARDALTYTQTTSPNRQEVFTGTVPNDENESEVFEGVRDRGRANAPKTGWMEWSPPGAEDPKALIVHPRMRTELIAAHKGTIIDLASRETQRQANPAVNLRAFNFERIDEEVERATDIEALARERFSIWPSPPEETEEPNNELDLEVWARHARKHNRVSKPESIAIVVGKGGGYASVALGCRFSDTTISVEHENTKKGTLWVAKHVAALKKLHPDALVVLDQKNATAILTDLTTEKVKYLSMNIDEIMGAYSSFIEAVNEGLVVHPPQPEVDKSLKAATPRAVGRSGFTWDASDPTIPVSITQAVTFAVWGVKKLESAPPKEPGTVRGYA